MARGRPKSSVDSESLSITLDERHLMMLDRLVKISLHGRNRNEAVASVVRHWLKDNLAALERAYRELEAEQQ